MNVKKYQKREVAIIFNKNNKDENVYRLEGTVNNSVSI